MVELAEARVMNKKMLKKLKRHHRPRHDGKGVEEEEDVECGGFEGHPGGVAAGGPIVVVLRGKHHHHHHHHHYHGVPCGTASFRDGEEHGYDHHHGKHHRRGSLGPVGHMLLEGLRGLKHHGRKHRHRCRGLGCHGGGDQHQQQDREAGLETPTAPPAEVMMSNLSLAEDKGAANKP